MHVVIRANGGHGIGYGHLVRSGTVADELLNRGHEITYATTTPTAVDNACPSDISIHTIEPEKEPTNFIEWLDKTNPTIVFTDSYEIGTDYQSKIRETGPLLASVIDDTRHTICSDIVINANIYASNLEYEWIGAEPKWCLGPKFILLRDEFRQFAAETASFRNTPQRGLIIMGGHDIEERTSTVMRAFKDTNLEVTVVVGPAYRNKETIYNTAKSLDIQFDIRETPDALAELMFHSDFAVTTLGTTVYELFATSTPMIGIPDNSTPIVEELTKRQLALVVSRETKESEIADSIQRLVTDRELRCRLQDDGSSIITSRGPQNVVDTLESIV